MSKRTWLGTQLSGVFVQRAQSPGLSSDTKWGVVGPPHSGGDGRRIREVQGHPWLNSNGKELLQGQPNPGDRLAQRLQLWERQRKGKSKTG